MVQDKARMGLKGKGKTRPDVEFKAGCLREGIQTRAQFTACTTPAQGRRDANRAQQLHWADGAALELREPAEARV